MSSAVTTGIFTLGGVLVGGAVSAVVAMVERSLDRRAESRQACRLLDADLAILKAAAELVMAGDGPPAIADDAIDRLVRVPESWHAYKATLARVLTGENWRAVAGAMMQVEIVREMHTRVDVEPDIEQWHELNAAMSNAHMALAAGWSE